MDFLRLDEGSYFVHWATVLYQLRLNDRDAALHVTRQAADEPTRRLMQPCLEGVRGAALDAAVAGVHTALAAQRRSRSGTTRLRRCCSIAAVRRKRCASLERAVDGNFCSYPALDLDPIWAGLRSDPEFQRIRTKAMACHDRFRRVVEARGGPANR